MADVSPPEAAARYRAIIGTDPVAARAADDYFAEHEPTYASMLRTSISPTMFNAGYRINVIPSEAKATLDVRMVPDEDPDQFMEEVRRVIDDPTVTPTYVTDPGLLRPAAPLAQLDSEAFRTIQSAVARDYDTVTIPMMGTGATDMAQVRGLGLQCYGIGPAADVEDGPKGFGAHSDQERILEPELHRFVKFSWDVVVGLARTRSN
jgi:acetylornithine deacetylase/succinyl-diaminopimelate desuccinylase-like protein